MVATARPDGSTSLEEPRPDRTVPRPRTICELRLLRRTEAVLPDACIGTELFTLEPM
jgi:hypothetical protein